MPDGRPVPNEQDLVTSRILTYTTERRRHERVAGVDMESWLATASYARAVEMMPDEAIAWGAVDLGITNLVGWHGPFRANAMVSEKYFCAFWRKQRKFDWFLASLDGVEHAEWDGLVGFMQFIRAEVVGRNGVDEVNIPIVKVVVQGGRDPQANRRSLSLFLTTRDQCEMRLHPPGSDTHPASYHPTLPSQRSLDGFLTDDGITLVVRDNKTGSMRVPWTAVRSVHLGNAVSTSGGQSVIEIKLTVGGTVLCNSDSDLWREKCAAHGLPHIEGGTETN